jgi:hypothetical protein
MRHETDSIPDWKSDWLDPDFAGPVLSTSYFTLFATLMPVYPHLFPVFYRSGKKTRTL